MIVLQWPYLHNEFRSGPKINGMAEFTVKPSSRALERCLGGLREIRRNEDLAMVREGGENGARRGREGGVWLGVDCPLECRNCEPRGEALASRLAARTRIIPVL